MRKTLNSFKIPLILFCVGIVFHHPFENFLTKFLVAPVLSEIEFDEEPITAIAFIVIFAIILAGLIRKLYKHYQFSKSWIIWAVISAITYSYYLINKDVWIFHELYYWQNMSIRAADVIFLFLIFFIIAFIINEARTKKNIEESDKPGGFLFDEPKSIDEKNDPHERHRFARTLKEKIKTTLPGNNSFAIGIIGKWGDGKTTFMKTIQETFSSDPEIIPLHFNPWMIPGSGNITEAFFGEFSSKLSHYIDNIDSDIKAYVQLILQDKNLSIPLIAAEYLSPSINWRKSGVDQLKDKINSSIKLLNRKIVVYMDDLDRLDKNEIMEALRLIRNSADFSNVFFVVAFDRVQVVEAIKESFEFGHDRYLEKIFQIEFYLTPLKRDTILTEVIVGLNKILDKADREVLMAMFENESRFGNTSYEWIQEYFNHHRDVVRFLNQFSLYYEFVKREVFLPDFIILMLVRLKFPEVYHLFYQNQGKYLLVEASRRFSTQERELVLKYSSDQKTRADSLLLQDIQALHQKLGIQQEDERPFNLINNIFGARESTLHWVSSYKTDLPKSHLSVVIPRFFNRYFDYSLTGRLSDVEFDEALNTLDKQALFTKINEWLKDKNKGGEVISNLERTTDYNNKDIFDKVISGLILAANTSLPDKPERKYYVNENEFLNRFDWSQNGTKRALSLIFEDQEHLNQYLRELIKGNRDPDGWLYDVLRKQAREKYYHLSLPIDEIRDYIKDTVDHYFSQKPKIDWGLRLKLLDRKECSTEKELNPFLEKVQAYFMENLNDAIPMFIGPCQRHSEEGNYRIYSDWVEIFFGSDENFITKVGIHEPEYGKELRLFQQAIKNDSNYPDCTKFEFKNLPIRP